MITSTFFSLWFPNPLFSILLDDLSKAIALAKEILIAKVDPGVRVDQNALTSNLDNEVKKVMSKY